MIQQLLPKYIGYITLLVLALYIFVGLFRKKFKIDDLFKLSFAVPSLLQLIKNIGIFGRAWLDGIYYITIDKVGVIENHFLLVGLSGAAYMAGTGILKIFFIDVPKALKAMDPDETPS